MADALDEIETSASVAASEDESRRTFSRRAVLLAGGQVAALGLVAWRLYELQVMQEGRWVPLADDNRIALRILAPVRGRILDRKGRTLADNVEQYRATLTRGRTGDLRQTLARFARVVPIAADEQERIVQRALRQSRSTPVVVASELSFEQAAEIGLLAPRLPGVEIESWPRRTYPAGAAMAHVTGYVGAVERLALDDPPVTRVPGFRVGKAGVELGMEEELRGVAGAERREVDARGRIVRSLDEAPPIAGRDVRLTIDATLQARAVERLAKERRAALAALDIPSGEVLALASVPGFDAEALMRGLGAEDWRRINADVDKPLLNRAVGGLYPPGSTFKMVTALAALEAGVVTAKERVGCWGSFEFHGQTFRCWNRGGHGGVDLNRAIAESCDVYFYEMARRVGIAALSRMARRLGLGEPTGAGVALEKAGVVPDPDWKRGETGRGWLGGETILTGIGQGFVTATPLQLAVMTARIASGLAVAPSVIRDEAGPPRAFASLGLGQAALEAVRRGMIACVNDDGGTGGNAQLIELNVRVAGKTGTSQIARASSERGGADLPWELRDHALFVGYAPAGNPRFAAAAVVEHGGSGGAAAAPIVRDVLRMLLEAEAADGSPPRGAGSTGAAARRDG